jgi:integrase/recombinase XerD
VIVHRVLTAGAESWTVLGEDGLPAEPAEAYLAYLAALERSPNTLRAYAHSLRMWLEFLSGQRVGWREAGVEQVARFAAWLRAPAANVIVLDAGESARTAAAVNRHLAAFSGFMISTPGPGWGWPPTWSPGAGWARLV